VDDVTIGPPTTMRGRAGRLAQRVLPNLDEAAYFRARRRDMSASMDSGAYDDLMARRPGAAQPLAGAPGLGRPTHVVVVPSEGRDFDSWAPGTRNFYYEAAQNLRESIGADHVSVFHVERGEPSAQWHVRLIDYLLDTGATHLLTHIESDPGTDAQSWTWDTLWSLLSARWDGVLLGVMFDSAYRFTEIKSRFLARMSPNFMVVDICMPMDGSMKKGRFEVGPVNMPMSWESMALIDRRLASVEDRYDVSFVGVLYPYRVEMIEALKAHGISVAVNPHRGDTAVDRSQTLANQPSWLDYMAGLASSRATINFSQSAARPIEQLKTRVLEAGLAGTLLLTDDRDRTRLFWTPEVEYGCFTDVTDLPSVLERFLSDPVKLAYARTAFRERSRELAHTNFWGAIEDGLQRRGLPLIGE
jgi:hypothetical protein